MIQIIENPELEDQKWHARIVSSGNNAKLVHGEQVSSKGDALNTIVAVAREFGFQEPNIWMESGGFFLRDGLHVKANIEQITLVAEED